MRFSSAPFPCQPYPLEEMTDTGMTELLMPLENISLEDQLANIGVSFHDKLFELIDEAHLDNKDVWKRAMGMNIMRMKGRAKMMRTIKVTGKGKIAVKPDKIRLYVNKEELCKEYEDTLRRSTEDTELLKDLFEKLGFQRKDLKTVYFNVDTEYESYQDRDKSWKRRFKGYKYNHHMKIEFAADNKRLGQVLYALAHSSLRPEFSIEYTVADVEKCKNELLHKAIEDSIQKAQVLTTAANVKLGEIQAIDYSWGEIDFVTKPLNEMRLMECTECEMSAPGAYDIDIEADDINVTDTATVIWEIA